MCFFFLCSMFSCISTKEWFVFRTLNQEVTAFIWLGKVPRITKEILQKWKNSGGLHALNTMMLPGVSCCNLESQSCHSSSLSALICFSLPLSLSCHSFSSGAVHFKNMDRIYYVYLKLLNLSWETLEYLQSSSLVPLMRLKWLLSLLFTHHF